MGIHTAIAYAGNGPEIDNGTVIMSSENIQLCFHNEKREPRFDKGKPEFAEE